MKTYQNMKTHQKKLFFVITLLVTLLMAITAIAEENLILNGDFSQPGTGNIPKHWFTQAWYNQENYTIYETENIGVDDDHSFSIWNLDDNDARLVQVVKVKPNTSYKLSGYIRTENVEDNGWGANLSIGGVFVMPQGFYGDYESWQYVESYGTTGPDQSTIEIWARLGGYSGESKGKAYFDNISLVEIQGPPFGAAIENWYTQSPDGNEVISSNTALEEDTDKPWLLWGALLLGYLLVMILLYRFLENNKDQYSIKGVEENKKLVTFIFAFGLLLSLLIRLIISARSPGYGVDMNCFISWGHDVATIGPGGFYQAVSFCDYPPGYLYILGLLGWINQGLYALGQQVSWIGSSFIQLQRIVIRLVPNLADLAGAVLLYRFAKKRFSPLGALSIGLLYAFNPLTFINSAAWGQIDSVLALGLMAVVLFSMERNWKWVLPAFVLSILVKPQALMFGPLGLLAIILSFCWQKDKEKRKKDWISLLVGLVISLGLALLIIVPFKGDQPMGWLIALYKKTLASYPHATVNAANFFYLLGGNWVEIIKPLGKNAAILSVVFGCLLALTNGYILYKKGTANPSNGSVSTINFKKPSRYAVNIGLILFGLAYMVFGFGKVSFELMGNFALVAFILWACWLFFQGKSLSNLPMVGAAMLIEIFVFAGKMHERYIYPALLLLFLAYLVKKDYRILWLIGGITATIFLNVGIILHNDIIANGAGGHLSSDTHVLNQIISFVNVFVAMVTLWVTGSYVTGDNQRYLKIKPADNDILTVQDYSKTYKPNPQNHHMNFGKKDWVIVVATTLIYAVVAFTNLGSTVAPQSKWTSVSSSESIIIDTHGTGSYKMLYYGGVNEKDFHISTSEDGVTWENYYTVSLDNQQCFKWKVAAEVINTTEVEHELTGRYVKITAGSAGLNLWEVVFRDEEGQNLPAEVKEHILFENEAAQTDPAALFDEQDVLQGDPGWFNSAYFDEIYHARTGYEHHVGIAPYETTHPPLGKVFMSWAIALFGMTPFGWRFAGALVGVLMVPAMYLLAKQLLKKRSLATGAMLFMAFDLMHFAQTRIATIDSFPVLFIILAYWAMLRYMQTDVYAVSWPKKLLPLGLSGFFMGLAMASKWIGAYAAIGLAILFFWASWRNLNIGIEIKKQAQKDPVIKKKKTSAEKQTGESSNVPEPVAKEPAKVFVYTCLWCLLFFIVVPVIIYALSYIPYFAPSGGITLQKLIDAQVSMFSYHAKPGFGADHFFASPWWQWPIIGKPMWYASSTIKNGLGSTIMAMGNPVVWWVGLVAFFIVLAAFIKRHIWTDHKNQLLHLRAKTDYPAIAFVLIGLASQFVPWMLVPRGTYIYHYFASVPFIILCSVMVIDWVSTKWPKAGNLILWTLVALSAVAFIFYFPYASGLSVPTQWLALGKRLFPFPLYY